MQFLGPKPTIHLWVAARVLSIRVQPIRLWAISLKSTILTGPFKSLKLWWHWMYWSLCFWSSSVGASWFKSDLIGFIERLGWPVHCGLWGLSIGERFLCAKVEATPWDESNGAFQKNRCIHPKPFEIGSRESVCARDLSRALLTILDRAPDLALMTWNA